MERRSRWFAVVIAVVALAAVAIVARSRPSHPFTSLGGGPAATSVNEVTPPKRSDASVSATRSIPVGDDDGSSHSQLLGSLLLGLLAAGAVLALTRYTTGRWGFDVAGRRAKRIRHGADLPAAVATTPSELTDAVDQGLDGIGHGEVSDAIVLCWVRVQDAAGHAGVPARPSETSTEFVDRVLGAFGARERSLRRMSALYREARFSAHVMDETSRAEARECLYEIRTDLGAAHESA